VGRHALLEHTFCLSWKYWEGDDVHEKDLLDEELEGSSVNALCMCV
jgi:hypothetical protein